MRGRRRAAGTALALALLSAAPAAGQEEMGAWLSPVLGRHKATVSYEGSAYPERPVEGQDASLRLDRHEVKASVPLAQGGDREWLLNARAGLERLDTEARLPDSGDRVPDRLWDLRLGLTHRRLLDSGTIAGVHAAVASPSDHPFSGWDQVSPTATVFLRVPGGDRDAWLFFVNYSRFRGLLNGWPLPGLGYLWSPSDRLRATVGVPFLFVDYRPTGELALVLTAFPGDLGARLTWQADERVSLYGALGWGGREYLREGRDDRKDRLRLQEASAKGGLRLGVASGLSLELFGGYAFRRTLSESSRAWGSHDSLDVGAGPFAGLQARFTP